MANLLTHNCGCRFYAGFSRLGLARCGEPRGVEKQQQIPRSSRLSALLLCVRPPTSSIMVGYRAKLDTVQPAYCLLPAHSLPADYQLEDTTGAAEPKLAE